MINRTALLFLSLLFISPIGLAENTNDATLPGGGVKFKGIITDAACTVDVNSSQQHVVLGQVRSSEFADLGSYAAPVPFSIVLEDCSTTVSQRVGVIFKGVTDGKDPQVLAAGIGAQSAEGVGIGIFDENNDLVPLNTSPIHFSALNEGRTILNFVAKYRATSRHVTPGDASAFAYFTLVYM